MADYEHLTELERRLWNAIGTGDSVTVLVGDPERDDPANGTTWHEDRKIRAEFLVELATADLSPNGQRPRALRLCGARVTGKLDLTGLTLACPLEFEGCSFEEPVTLAGARAPMVGLKGSHVPSLNARQLETRGDLDLFQLRATSVSLAGAHVGGQLGLNGATLTNPGDQALNAERIRVEGTVFCQESFSAQGEVRFLGAQIGGELNMSGSRLHNPDGAAFTGDGLQVDASFWGANGFAVDGELRLLGARIGGQLNLPGARLTNSKGPALNADHLQVGGHASCANSSVQGEINLAGAQIGGQLSFEGASLTNREGLECPRFERHGDLTLFSWSRRSGIRRRCVVVGVGSRIRSA